MDGIHKDNFYVERHRVLRRSLDESASFSSVLNRHALVMFDAANPDLDKSQCIKLGGRLAEVQTDWINLLCPSEAILNRQDQEYRKAVTGIVKTFTNKMMDVVVDDKRVTFNELASIGLVHSHLSAKDQRRLDETRQLFQHYVASLCKLHGRAANKDIHVAGLQVLQVANVLGASLDYNIYK